MRPHIVLHRPLAVNFNFNIDTADVEVRVDVRWFL